VLLGVVVDLVERGPVVRALRPFDGAPLALVLGRDLVPVVGVGRRDLLALRDVAAELLGEGHRGRRGRSAGGRGSAASDRAANAAAATAALARDGARAAAPAGARAAARAGGADPAAGGRRYHAARAGAAAGRAAGAETGAARAGAAARRAGRAAAAGRSARGGGPARAGLRQLVATGASSDAGGHGGGQDRQKEHIPVELTHADAFRPNRDAASPRTPRIPQPCDCRGPGPLVRNFGGYYRVLKKSLIALMAKQGMPCSVPL